MRLASGHRKYDQEQISQARLIHSLRQAGVGLAEIARFLTADAEKREKLLQRWRHESEVKLLSVQIANQFLQGFRPEQNELHLVNIEQELFVIWYTVTVHQQGPLPYRQAILDYRQRLLSHGVKVIDDGYVRTLDAQGDQLIGEIGFHIRPKDVGKVPRLNSGFTIRQIPFALFATLEHKYGETYVCQRILSILHKFGFKQAGGHFDKYITGNDDRLLLYVPVTIQS
jgi:DNA-binding transcriptional MerR regulator